MRSVRTLLEPGEGGTDVDADIGITSTGCDPIGFAKSLGSAHRIECGGGFQFLYLWLMQGWQ